MTTDLILSVVILFSYMINCVPLFLSLPQKQLPQSFPTFVKIIPVL